MHSWGADKIWTTLGVVYVNSYEERLAVKLYILSLVGAAKRQFMNWVTRQRIR